MTGRILPDRTRLLQAQAALASCDPDQGHRPCRSHPLSPDRIERGAIAIYGEVTGNKDPDAAVRKWATAAKENTKARHRAEAEACLRAAN